MNKELIFYLFILFFVLNGNSQINFYQDVCKCGVTGAGFSTGLGAGNGQLNIHLETGSEIKKAFLFVIKFGESKDTTINFNGTLVNPNNPISNFQEFGNAYASIININYVDVTNLIDISTSSYFIDIPLQTYSNCIGCSYGAVYLYVIYENINLLNTSTSIYVNNKNSQFVTDFTSKVLNPVKQNFPISFAIHTDRIGEGFSSGSSDGSYLYFFNNSTWDNLGLLKGGDNVNYLWESGVKGHFYYQNNQLFGLDDDTPDNIVGGTDGLLNVINYLLPNNTLKWNFQWEINKPNGAYNIYSNFFITHSTPCDTFSVSVPNDTTICAGAPLQLNVSGGSAVPLSHPTFEWDSPNPNALADLSCTTCPNPVFTGDSSRFYTVRVWNTDSCSVVRPLRIKVLPKPMFQNLQLTNSSCLAPSGMISLANSAGMQYSLDNSNWQSNGNFSSLGLGTYHLFVTDSNACVNDTFVNINSLNDLSASFTANPQSGAAPLSVSFNNTSQNAASYSWTVFNYTQSPPTIIGTSSVTEIGPITFDSSGNYNIELVAYGFDSTCIDTFSIEIFVYDSLMVQVPNVFTPNGDGVNDEFMVSTNVPVYCELQIFNRWGNEVFTFSGNLLVGTNVLWNPQSLSPLEGAGGGITDGTYFYKMKLSSKEQSLEKEGFVQVVR